MNETLMLERLASASLQLALAFLFVWCLCTAVPKLPASIRCWLWRLALLKGLLSLVWVGSLPLLPAPVNAESAADHFEIAAPVPLAIPRPVVVAAPVVEAFDWSQATACIWLIAAAVALVRLAILAVQSRRLRQDSKPISSSYIQQLAGRLGERLRLRKTPSLRGGEEIQVPLVTGILRPVVILPAAIDERDVIEPALAHELAHIKRSDLFWDLVVALARAVFWFHPLAWIAASRARIEAEIACDAIAIQASDASPRAYGSLLLGLAQCKPTTYGLSLSFDSTKALKRRLSEMGKEILPRRSFAKLLLACVLPAVLALIPLQLVEAQSAPSKAAPILKEKGYAAYSSSGALLLWDPVVRNELNLSRDQIDRLDKATADFGKEVRALGDKLAEFNREKISNKERLAYDSKERPALYERLTARSLAVLTPIQHQRLRELNLQRRGLSAAGRAEVAAQLGLPETVRQKIAALYKAFVNDAEERNRKMHSDHIASYYIKVREHTPAEKQKLAQLRNQYHVASGAKRDELWTRITAIEARSRRPKQLTEDEFQRGAHDIKPMYEREQRRTQASKEAMEAKIRAMLTAEQLQKWEQMLGEKIQFSPPGSFEQYVWDGAKYVKKK